MARGGNRSVPSMGERVGARPPGQRHPHGGAARARARSAGHKTRPRGRPSQGAHRARRPAPRRVVVRHRGDPARGRRGPPDPPGLRGGEPHDRRHRALAPADRQPPRRRPGGPARDLRPRDAVQSHRGRVPRPPFGSHQHPAVPERLADVRPGPARGDRPARRRDPDPATGRRQPGRPASPARPVRRRRTRGVPHAVEGPRRIGRPGAPARRRRAGGRGDAVDPRDLVQSHVRTAAAAAPARPDPVALSPRRDHGLAGQRRIALARRRPGHRLRALCRADRWPRHRRSRSATTS